MEERSKKRNYDSLHNGIVYGTVLLVVDIVVVEQNLAMNREFLLLIVTGKIFSEFEHRIPCSLVCIFPRGFITALFHAFR